MTYTPDQLVTAMEQLDCPVTKRRLLDWVQKALLPPSQAYGRGRGRGKVYEWTEPDILHRAIDVYDLLTSSRRAQDIFLPLWLLGYEVPMPEVRDGLRRWAQGVASGITAEIPPGGDRSDLVSDVVQFFREQQRGQPTTFPQPLFAAFVHAVMAPQNNQWGLILDDLRMALPRHGDELPMWPTAAEAEAIVLFIRDQLSIDRLCEAALVASESELAQVHRDLRAVVPLVRTVGMVGSDVEPDIVTRLLVVGALCAAVVDLALRRAGRGELVDSVVTHVVDGCRRMLTDPQLRRELHQLRTEQSGTTGQHEADEQAHGADESRDDGS